MTVPEFEYSQLQQGLWAGRNPLFRNDVEELARVGVKRILDLREPAEWLAPRFGEEALEVLEEFGIRRVHLPTRDKKTVAPETLTQAVAVIQEAMDAGEGLYIHCRGGIERTGAVLVAWRTSTRGDSYDEALRAFWAKRPILSPLLDQRRVVEEWLGQRRNRESA